MPFVWVTNVGVGADIDAADRNETKTHIGTLYTTLGANWPGNVRFPVCVGAGYDVAAPCPVVWDIAAGDDIYQTPGAHPVSELQEARDKLDWIWDNKCAADNAGHDNPVNGAANPTTQGAANPTTNAIAESTEDAVTQAVANPVTQAVAEITEDLITQAVANPATQFEDQMGNVAHCPLENTGEDGTVYTGEDSTAYPTNQGIYVGAEKGADLDLNQSGDENEDFGGVQGGHHLSVDGLHDILDRTIYVTNHCFAEFGAEYTHVQYDGCSSDT